jgi:hypothetical protein
MTCFESVLICAGRVDPRGIRQAHQHEGPSSRQQPTDRYGLLILRGAVVRPPSTSAYHCNRDDGVYQCNHGVVVVVLVAALQAVLQVAWSVVVHTKVCTDALSVSYPPGAQVERSSRCSRRQMWTHAAFTCDGATKDGLGGTARREKADNTRRVVSGHAPRSGGLAKVLERIAKTPSRQIRTPHKIQLCRRR